MAQCPYYKVHVMTTVRNPIGQPRQAQHANVPWCAHVSSPVIHAIAVGTVGGGNLLACGGDLALCQVAPGQR